MKRAHLHRLDREKVDLGCLSFVQGHFLNPPRVSAMLGSDQWPATNQPRSPCALWLFTNFRQRFPGRFTKLFAMACARRFVAPSKTFAKQMRHAADRAQQGVSRHQSTLAVSDSVNLDAAGKRVRWSRTLRAPSRTPGAQDPSGRHTGQVRPTLGRRGPTLERGASNRVGVSQPRSGRSNRVWCRQTANSLR